jgi:hypothetical protein
MKDRTFRKVVGGLAAEFRRMGVDRAEDKAIKAGQRAAPRADAEIEARRRNPAPALPMPDRDAIVPVKAEVEVPTDLVEGYKREVQELQAGGRSEGAPTVGYHDTPAVREAFAELRHHRQGNAAR